MRRIVPLVALFGLVSCSKPAIRPTPVVAPTPEAPSWLSDSASGMTIRAVGCENLPIDSPPRLARDLADARACELAREAFAIRASSGLRRLLPGGSDSAKALAERLRSAILRGSFQGCVIARTECREVAGDRRWCWSAAELDTSETVPSLQRELQRFASVSDSISPAALLDSGMRR